MTAALALAPKTLDAPVPRRRALGLRPAWRDRLDERAAARALAIAQRHNVPELLARILAGRGVEVDEVEAFLDPTVRRLMPDPHTVTAMEQAAQRLADAMMRGEQVAIFGDYDVDGATASALLARFLRIGGTEPIVHIPDRIFEGYGPNVEAIRALAARGATLLVTVDCGTASIEPLAEARRLGHGRHRARPPPGRRATARRDRGQSQPARRSVGAWPSRRGRPRVHDGGRGQPRAPHARLLDRGAAGAGPARLARHRRARHRRRRGAAQGPQPRLRRQGAAGAAPPRQRRPHRADGCGAAVRPAGAVSSGLPARAAHQRRRPHRPRRSRRAAASHRRSGRSRPHRRRARPPQRRAPRHGGGDAGGGAGRGHGRARHRGKGRGGGDGGRELASRRGGAAGRAAEGALQPAGLCHCARARRHRHRLGPLDPRRRSRQGGAPRGRRGAAAQGRRSCHGGGRHGQARRAGGIPRLSRTRAGRGRRRGARRSGAADRRRGERRRRQCRAGRDDRQGGAVRRRQPGAGGGVAQSHRSPMPIRSGRPMCACGCARATARCSTPSPSAQRDSRSARR